MIVISKKQLKKKITIDLAIESVRNAFIASSSGMSIGPAPFVFELPENQGEICIKTAFIEGYPTYSIKQVSVMNKNSMRNLPTLNSTMNVYDRETGILLAVINEGGWLTNMRTACAGVIAEELFRKENSSVLGIIGAGTQADWQATVILYKAKNYKKAVIWNRTEKNAAILKETLSRKYPGIEFKIASSVEELVSESDTIVCTTPSQNPLVKNNMEISGKTIISIGSDMPNKCEVDPLLFARADAIFVDNIQSNQLLGNIKRAIDSGVIKLDNITGEIGTLLRSKNKGRSSDNELIIVSLVGIGAQDTCVGNFAFATFDSPSKTKTP